MLRGALLIGGLSRRMGFPKALLPRGTGSLGAFLCELLASATGTEPVLVGRGSIGSSAPAYERVPDLVAGAGPLAAILGLFHHGPETDWLVLATDLAAMNREALDWLCSQTENTAAAAIWPRLPDRPFGEPLAAVYRKTAFPLLESYWHREGRALKGALTPGQRYEPEIPALLRPAFANANTPRELERIQQGRHGPDNR